MAEEGIAGIGAAASGFMEGFLKGRALRERKRAQEVEQRYGKVSTIFNLAAAKKAEANNPQLTAAAKEQLAQEADALQFGAMKLLEAVDSPTKKTGQNFFQKILGIGGKKGSEFAEILEQVVSGGGIPGQEGSRQAQQADQASAERPDVGYAPAPSRTGMSGLFQGKDDDVGYGVVAKPSAPDGGYPLSSIMKPPEGRYQFGTQELADKARQAFTAASQYMRQKGIRTKEDLLNDPHGQQILGDIQTIAISGKFTNIDEMSEILERLGIEAPKDLDERIYSDLLRAADGNTAIAATLFNQISSPGSDESRVFNTFLAQHPNDPEAARQKFGEFKKQFTKSAGTAQMAIIDEYKRLYGEKWLEKYREDERSLKASGGGGGNRFQAKNVGGYWQNYDAGTGKFTPVVDDNGKPIPSGDISVIPSWLLTKDWRTGQDEISATKAALALSKKAITLEEAKMIADILPDKVPDPYSESGFADNPGKKTLLEAIRKYAASQSPPPASPPWIFRPPKGSVNPYEDRER